MSENKVISRSAFLRNTSEEMLKNRQVEFVISSESVDTYRTVFKIDGWDLARYEENNIVCYQHRANSDDPDDVIGTSEVFVENNELIGRVTFEDAETNPKAEKVFRKVCNGTLKMASINALASEYRYGDTLKGEDKEVLYFTRQELMEWSIVSVGSNPDALKRSEEAISAIRTELVENIEVVVEQSEFVENKRTVLEAQLIINKNKY